jgi:hypothetical protein
MRSPIVRVLVLLLALAIPLGTAQASASPAPDRSAGSAADSAAKPAAAFRHPGVLVTTAQLDLVRSKLAAGAEPWTTAYDAMRTSTYASLSYTPTPRAIVECGSNSNPNIGCTDERTDALAAYTHALLWYLTKDRRYAEKATQIMDAWSGTITDHINSNAPLQTGWSGASWSRAAELIRYTYDGWPTGRVQRFESMLRNVYLPELVNGAAVNKNGNWELIMTDAAIGIAVFLNDRATFDRALATARCRIPAYFYLRTDGDYPKIPCGSSKDTPEELVEYWHGQTTFVDGLSQETCRRFGYAGWGIEATSHIAETAWIQGVDLYGEIRPRVTKSLEFHAKYDLGEPVPDWLCGGTIDDGLGPTLEVAHNHYRNRAGIKLPKTLQVIQANRPMGANYFLAWETLTHAMNP